MFVHLNVHSNYSQMRGMATQQALLTQARNYGMQTMAITETNGVWGFIRYVQHCKAAGILPIAGVNLITQNAEIVILVENQLGYENMCKAISRVHENIDQSVTEIFSAGHSGLFLLAYQKKVLNELSQFIPKSNLFVEIRPDVEESQAHVLAKQYGLEMVATGDVYFMKPEDQKAHRILRAIENNTTLSNLDTNETKSERHWFRSEKDMIELFPNSLAAINNSV